MQEQFFRQQVNSGMLNKMPKKVLVKLNSAQASDATMGAILKEGNLDVHKIRFNNSDCRAQIRTDP